MDEDDRSLFVWCGVCGRPLSDARYPACAECRAVMRTMQKPPSMKNVAQVSRAFQHNRGTDTHHPCEGCVDWNDINMVCSKGVRKNWNRWEACYQYRGKTTPTNLSNQSQVRLIDF